MDKLKKFLFWGSLFFIMSFTNFSTWCRHGIMMAANGFNYKPPTLLSQSIKPSFAAYQTVVEEAVTNRQAPLKLTWQMLQDVEYVKKWNKDYQMDIMFPSFGKYIKQYAGKEMYITGFLIPLNIEAGLYAVSKTNYASCFFCGKSGPESVVSLKFKKKPKRYKTDEYLTMKGTLELNDSNIGDFIYIFQNTEEYK